MCEYFHETRVARVELKCGFFISKFLESSGFKFIRVDLSNFFLTTETAI